jgi:hypothetical protein
LVRALPPTRASAGETRARYSARRGNMCDFMVVLIDIGVDK